MTVICVVHDDERVLDVAREGDHYLIREWDSGHREEIRLSETEASRTVQAIMELQRERRVGDQLSEVESPVLVHSGPFATNRR
jgi:hypothetical protein